MISYGWKTVFTCLASNLQFQQPDSLTILFANMYTPIILWVKGKHIHQQFNILATRYTKWTYQLSLFSIFYQGEYNFQEQNLYVQNIMYWQIV